MDDHDWYTRRVEQYERELEPAEEKRQAAAAIDERVRWSGRRRWLRRYLDEARWELEQFETDRERFVEQRRHELTEQMISLHSKLTRVWPEW